MFSKEYFNNIAGSRDKWRHRNSYYYKSLAKYFKHYIPAGSRVLELGCGTGDLLNSISPDYGMGIDISDRMIEIARIKYPHLSFIEADAENVILTEKFDYIIMSDLIGNLTDILRTFENVKKICDDNTRVIISYYNHLWEPILKFGEIIGLKMKQPLLNWLSGSDIENLFKLTDFDNIKTERKLLFPKYIPLLSNLLNKFIANIFPFNRFCLMNLLIAKKKCEKTEEKSISVIIPSRNEKGNIENAVKRIPEFATHQEIIFIEGFSKDGTYEEMIRVKELHKDKDIKVMKQTGKGKGNAVREAFDKASGDILMILDADLTVPPEDLPKFYNALISGKGEFINGSRLVYPMENQAMRFLNLIGNKFFGALFTYLLGQRLKDTLCGTKVLEKKNYVKIANNRSYFGDFDPFGDFDLLFGASKQNLKIIDLPVRYRQREYGETQIQRFSHGLLLLKMSLFAAKKIKFI